ncbi:hypothetical protein OD776_02295, partial [Pseudomonas aeruginosa]
LGTIFKTNSRASARLFVVRDFPFEPRHPPPLTAAPTPEMKTGRMRSPFRHRPAIRLRRMDGAG